MTKITLISLLFSISIHADASFQDSRLKSAFIAGSFVAAASIGFHIIKRRPIKLEKIAQQLTAFKQNPLLAQRHSTAQAFLRSYEQQHAIPENIEKLEQMQKLLEENMDKMYQARFGYSEKKDQEKMNKCDDAIKEIHADLIYIKNLKNGLAQFNRELK